MPFLLSSHSSLPWAAAPQTPNQGRAVAPQPPPERPGERGLPRLGARILDLRRGAAWFFWALGILGAFHSHGESPIAGWVIRGKPNITWMIWGYPYFRKPPIGVWYIMQDHARPCKTQVCDLDHIAQSILKFLKAGLADLRLDRAQQIARHTFEFLSTGASLVRLEADWWREH